MANLYHPVDLPDRLVDVVNRLLNWDVVYGFELELLADFVSR